MSDDKPKAIDTKDAMEAAASGAIEVAKEIAPGVVVGAGVAVGATATAMAIAMAAMLPGLIGIGWQAWSDRYRRRVNRLLESIQTEWASTTAVTPEVAAARLEDEAATNPEFAESISRAVRALMDAPSERATTILGVLLAEPRSEARRSDVYFRGVVRLLSDAEDVELDALQQLFAWLLSHPTGDAIVLTAVDQQQGKDGAWREVPSFIRTYVDGTPVEGGKRHRVPVEHVVAPQDGERLLALIEFSGLGFDYASTGLGGAAPGASLRRGRVERLHRLFSAAQSAAAAPAPSSNPTV